VTASTIVTWPPTAEAPDLKAEPALSVHWQHRAGLEQVLAQERQG
jgi:hypothetical protein